MRFNIIFFLYLILLLDSLFIPYAKIFSSTYGVLVLPVLLFFSLKKLNSQDFLLGNIAIGAIVLSFLYSFILFSEHSGYFLSAVRNSGIIIYMILLVPLIRSLRIIRPSIFIKILKIYIFFTTFLAVIFVARSSIYFQLRGFWTFNNNIIEVEELNVITRFTGILSDPNNAAGIIVGILAFIIFRQPSKLWRNLILCLCVFLIVICSMSITGILCFSLTVFVYFIFSNISYFRKLFSLFLLSGVIIYCYPIIYENQVYQIFIQRLEASNIDSRFSRWGIIFDANKTLSSIFIGNGGEVFWKGSHYKPHNGHFHVYYNYGLFAYVPFMLMFFPFIRNLNWRQHFFLVPIFITFSVNVGIYEPRFAGIWAMLVGMLWLQSSNYSKYNFDLLPLNTSIHN